MKVLFFAPFAGVPAFALHERAVLEAFVAGGHAVTLVRCQQLFAGHCPSMDAWGVSFKSPKTSKVLVCKRCIAGGAHLYGDLPSVETLHLSPHQVSSEPFVNAADFSSDRYAAFESSLHGVPVGRFAAYELLLRHKCSVQQLLEEHWNEYWNSLVNCTVSLKHALATLEKFNPDVLVVSNSLYGVNRVWKIAQQNRRKICYSLHDHSPTFAPNSRVQFYADDDIQVFLSSSPEAKVALKRPLTGEQVALVVRHLEAFSTGDSVWRYSAPRQALNSDEVRQAIGLVHGRPVVFIPLRSPDERTAAEALGVPKDRPMQNVFPDDYAWLSYMLKLADRRKELQFVVRPHPRMFPNRREGVRSPLASTIMNQLAHVPDNVIVDHPAENRSVYDLLTVSDVVVAGSTSVGLEALSRGVPTVVYDPDLLLPYPLSCVSFPTEPSELDGLIDDAMARGVSPLEMKKAFRYIFFNLMETTAATIGNPVDYNLNPSPRPRLLDFGTTSLTNAIKGRLNRYARLDALRISWISKRNQNLYREVISRPATLSEAGMCVKVALQGLDGLHELRNRDEEYQIQGGSAESELESLTLAFVRLRSS